MSNHKSKILQVLRVVALAAGVCALLIIGPQSQAIAQPVQTANSSANGKARPNILVIWGDDIGYSNLSAYNMGMMGYKTPNIDRLAREGMLFTDAYAQQSCTAGRASFLCGQHPFRTGLLS
jgi:hypothetical protein